MNVNTRCKARYDYFCACLCVYMGCEADCTGTVSPPSQKSEGRMASCMSISLNNTQIRTLRAPGTVLPAGPDVYTSTMNALVELDQQQPPLSASAAAK